MLLWWARRILSFAFFCSCQLSFDKFPFCFCTMVATCAVIGCTNRHASGAGGFYRFPANTKRRSLWLAAIRRRKLDGSPWTPNGDQRVCRVHFVTGKPSRDDSHPDHVPSLKLGYKSPRVESASAKVSCSSRRERFNISRQEKLANADRLKKEEESRKEKTRRGVLHDHSYFSGLQLPSYELQVK